MASTISIYFVLAMDLLTDILSKPYLGWRIKGNAKQLCSNGHPDKAFMEFENLNGREN